MNIIRIHNVETGEIIEREETAEETALREQLDAEHAAATSAIENERAARRAEILERLGLTEDEAKLILG